MRQRASLFSFKSEVHDFGTDEDGDPITVNVVSSENGRCNAIPSASRTETQAKPADGLCASCIPPGSAGLSLEDWNNQAKESGIGSQAQSRLNRYPECAISR